MSKINTRQRKAGLTPEEVDAFYDSDHYIELNVKIYESNNLVLVADQLMEEVAKGLKVYGIKMTDNLRQYLNMTKHFMGRFLDEFGQLYLPHEKEGMDNRIVKEIRTQNDIATNNWVELDEWCEKETKNAIDNGKRYRDWRKMRRNVGGGCNNCSKLKTDGCPTSHTFSDIEIENKTCMGYQKIVNETDNQ